MLKIVFDGNEKDGYSIHTKIPSELTTDLKGSNLIVDEAPTLIACVNKIRETILEVEGFDIFNHEFLIIHEDSAFEPGPHAEGEIKHFEELEDTLGVGAPVVQGFVNTPGDLVEGQSKTTSFDPNHNMTSEQMLEEVAQGKIDISTLPISYSDEPQDSEDKDQEEEGIKYYATRTTDSACKGL